jgi:hypothetical protein
MAVMGSGDIVAGKDQTTIKPRQPIVKDQTENAGGPRPSRPQQQMCGAMTQQGSDNRASSQPQEFVRLVGCRDPKVKPPGGH